MARISACGCEGEACVEPCSLRSELSYVRPAYSTPPVVHVLRRARAMIGSSCSSSTNPRPPLVFGPLGRDTALPPAGRDGPIDQLIAFSWIVRSLLLRARGERP